MRSLSNWGKRAGLRKPLVAVFAVLFLLLPLCAMGDGEMNIYTVTSPGSGGSGTLEAAIAAANALPAGSNFKIVIEIDGTLSASTRLDVADKTGWIQSRSGATIGGFSCRIEAGGILKLEDAIFYNSALDLRAIDVPVVSRVIVTPASIKANRGSSAQFAAVVEGEHLPPQDVRWTVENGQAGTSISDAGLLTISTGETARTLLVTATSAYDETVSGSAEVAVPAMSTAPALLVVFSLMLLLLAALLFVLI